MNPPISFRQFGLGEPILRAIQQAGYERPTQVQAMAIPKVMQGDDVIGIAQTGTGKTAVFLWPILQRLVQLPPGKRKRRLDAMILAPTRELAIQIQQNILSYGARVDVKVAAIYGGVEEQAQILALHKGVDIIVATPGRLMDLSGRIHIDFSSLGVLVLDEADRMLDMGFLGDIEKIVGGLPKRRQTLMFSATLSKQVESLARRFLYKPKIVQVGKRSNPADTVQQAVYEVPDHLKNAHLLALLQDPALSKVLVFTKMKDGANRLTEYLAKNGVKVSKLHSSRSQDQRNQALQQFKDGVCRVLVATDIAARGIDVDGVTHVVNFDFPVNPEDYVHRIGRTGRAEASGEAISFVPEHDLNLLQFLEFQIGMRLPRKRLKGFDYRAPITREAREAMSAKRDWRKRARESQARKELKPAKKQAKRPPRGGGPQKPPRAS